MKIVFLDGATIGEDIDLSGFEKLGETEIYAHSKQEEVKDRVKDADVIVVNKLKINEDSIGTGKNLKLVCEMATGTDNIDKEYLEKRGIEWRNVAAYSTESVAQHTFAMLFYLLENLKYYDDFVKTGAYANSDSFTHFGPAFHELSSMTWGIIGLGNIGRRVADIAKAFGARVIYYSASGAAPQEGYDQVDLDTLLRESDVLSIHAPLNEKTHYLMNEIAFSKMKPSSILLNLGRGPIVDESALVKAIKEGKILGAGLDVLEAEPMKKDSPLMELSGDSRLFVTPHIGWASKEARERLMKIVESQIKDFFSK